MGSHTLDIPLVAPHINDMTGAKEHNGHTAEFDLDIHVFKPSDSQRAASLSWSMVYSCYCTYTCDTCDISYCVC